MVWKKRIIILLVAVALVSVVPSSAMAYSVYEGNISSTYTNIFGDLNISPFDDYVFFRSGQYTYTLVVGDISLEGTTFTATDTIKNYTIDTTSNSGYGSSVYNYFVTDESGFSLDVGSNLIYSNLGSYPRLTERGEYYELFTAFLLCLALCLYALRSVLGFCVRTRH